MSNLAIINHAGNATWVRARLLGVLFFLASFLLVIVSGCYLPAPSPGLSSADKQSIIAPAAGNFYHGVFPGSASGKEDDITRAEVRAYEKLAGAHVAWVMFSNNWYVNRRFPLATARWIRDHGSAPYIRLMLRPNPELCAHDTVYNSQRIIDGYFDADLSAWAREAARFATPIFVDFGLECNGNWFPWCGMGNGGGEMEQFGDASKADGPERYVAAYRHIVNLMRREKATNISWVFHIAAMDDPVINWNICENYYPGDDVVDWVGVSIYGPQSPVDEECVSFRESMDAIYPRIKDFAPAKPIIIAEFGCSAGSAAASPEKWADDALADLLASRWPSVAGFSWWNENWQNDDISAHDTKMRLQSLPALAEIFHSRLRGAGAAIVTAPICR